MKLLGLLRKKKVEKINKQGQVSNTANEDYAIWKQIFLNELKEHSRNIVNKQLEKQKNHGVALVSPIVSREDIINAIITTEKYDEKNTREFECPFFNLFIRGNGHDLFLRDTDFDTYILPDSKKEILNIIHSIYQKEHITADVLSKGKSKVEEPRVVMRSDYVRNMRDRHDRTQRDIERSFR